MRILGTNHARRFAALTITCTAMAWCGALYAAAPTTAPAPAKPTFSERYSIVSDKNIFLRDRSRGAPTTASTQSSTHRSTPLPEETLMLTGIVLEDVGMRAYIEDSVTFRILKLAVGESVARGKITSIDLDAVEYERNGQRKWIVIGYDFTGRPAQIASSTTYTPADATTSPTTQAIDPNDPNLTQEQRMKLKRQMELKH
jgi:hypothetical protein